MFTLNNPLPNALASSAVLVDGHDLCAHRTIRPPHQRNAQRPTHRLHFVLITEMDNVVELMTIITGREEVDD